MHTCTSAQDDVCKDVRDYHNWGLSLAERVFDSDVEALDCLKVFHRRMLDAMCVATGAGFAEFLETHRHLTIGVL